MCADVDESTYRFISIQVDGSVWSSRFFDLGAFPENRIIWNGIYTLARGLALPYPRKFEVQHCKHVKVVLRPAVLLRPQDKTIEGVPKDLPIRVSAAEKLLIYLALKKWDSEGSSPVLQRIARVFTSPTVQMVRSVRLCFLICSLTG